MDEDSDQYGGSPTGVAEARSLTASFAESLNAREAISGHPEHGIRPNADEMTNAVEVFVASGASPANGRSSSSKLPSTGT